MSVTLPEGDLQSRLERYLEGFRNRHGLGESAVEGNVVRLVVEPNILPEVLATVRSRLRGSRAPRRRLRSMLTPRGPAR